MERGRFSGSRKQHGIRSGDRFGDLHLFNFQPAAVNLGLQRHKPGLVHHVVHV